LLSGARLEPSAETCLPASPASPSSFGPKGPHPNMAQVELSVSPFKVPFAKGSEVTPHHNWMEKALRSDVSERECAVGCLFLQQGSVVTRFCIKVFQHLMLIVGQKTHQIG
jgi:hypothetical protein